MTAQVHGGVAPGFEPVADAFARNLTHRGEIGAACAIYRHGIKVVDLWGGHRDPGRREPWTEQTMVPVFSTTKGISALAVAHAVSAGLFDYDDLVAQHWPEFAQHGKDDITVRQLLAHQAGLCAIDTRLDEPTIADPDALAVILAAQRPAWRPGEHHGYHCWNLGWYQSELIRRTDPAGRTLGRYLAEELTGPLAARFFLGLPDTIDSDQIAGVKSFSKALMPLRMPPALVLSFLNPCSLALRAMGNPAFLLNHHSLNQPAIRRLEIGSGNGIGTARAIARLYAEFLQPTVLTVTEPARTALQTPGHDPIRGNRDLVLKTDIRFSLGMMKPGGAFGFGTDARAYGFWGAGGTCGFADPATGTAYAYVMNRMGSDMFGSERESALRTAYYHCAQQNPLS
ncbi:serine hydrolase domain-containing protein [Plantactinospora sp. KLBMP9567]|uniref:serine hydrolase domain-containing protein n=1 Tax=Plantactinospora sp. KLBMP9567 TaxID=3085900 RepID=UPI0029821A3B|nr:serine hydrolase domain-containing protein [Plantactinospora sp. KLBMP9567]MDW5326720.1 serine hydrolase domain-containing protein [Plantactinospora sp. KLBMP9567]